MNIFDKYLSKHQERIVGLDIMRSVAIFLVVYAHAKYFYPKSDWEWYQFTKIIRIDGVAIFFVLSGFLIGGILLKIINTSEFTQKDLLNFWIRRWFRTIPNYLLLIFVALFLQIYFTKGIGSFNFKYLLFLQNFITPHPSFYPELWSLPIEEWFYLLFPVCCYVFHKFLKNKDKSILISAIIFLIFPLVLRIVKFELSIGVSTSTLEQEFRKITLLRLDSLMYGVIAAYIVFKHAILWEKYKYQFLVAGIVLVILFNMNFYFQFINFYHPILFNIESVITLCFLPFLSTYKTTKFKIADSVFIFLSIISYSMYLLNLTPIQTYFLPTLDNLTGLKSISKTEIDFLHLTLYYIFTIVFSYLLYTIYENPMTKLRDKIKVK